MNWQLKAKIQNLISILPSSFSYEIYYWIQRNLGRLKAKKLNPISQLNTGINFCDKLLKIGKSPVDRKFLEIGTGRRINILLAFWLLGAKQIISVDLNPYLKEELVKDDLKYIYKNKTEIEKIFGNRIFNDRLNALLRFIESPYCLVDLFKFISFQYIAPGDASQLCLDSQSIDFHVSNAVFEHIPPEVLKMIIKEGNRILKNDGLFIHKIDYHDHFSTTDKSISPINFLQFSDSEWNKIAGNRYMYMNRLRHDDFLTLFQEANHQILIDEPYMDQRIFDDITQIKLDEKFISKEKNIIATTSAWIVSSKEN